MMIPCALCHLDFDIDLSDTDEVQVLYLSSLFFVFICLCFAVEDILSDFQHNALVT